ncbi:hypothetical protein [Haladaptatus sp. NG-SE-30]
MSNASDPTGDGVTPQFRVRDDRPGLTIIDPLERAQYSIETARPIELQAVPAPELSAPVGAVTSLTTTRIRLPFLIGAYVRDSDGDTVLVIDHETATTLPAAAYDIELSAPIKTYLHLDAAVEIDTSDDRLTLTFDREARVLVGSRSLHSRPMATVTTTPDPTDVMAAISTFGSALKTTSPERSFPTLRGHPPTVEFGDDLHVPDAVRPPETGVRIEIPPEYESIFPVTSLAYYHGATLAPGTTPRIVTDNMVHSLDHPERGFEGEVERVLKQSMFLDCVTRTEGLYRFDLHERKQVEPLVDLDFAALYDAPLPNRLESYLDVPFSTIADTLPTWRLSVHVTNEAENVTRLPYVLRDLPLIRMAEEAQETGDAMSTVAGIKEFTRAVNPDVTPSTNPAPEEEYVTTPDIDTLESAWLGTGAPVGGNKLLRSGFENRLTREQSTEDIQVTIVCNDSKMRAEWDDRLYGTRTDLPFDVTTRQNCSTATLRELLGERVDLFHYIGHVEDGAFVCSDGLLDPETVESVGVDMFLLNACQSYVPGKRLVEAGSIGGIVTYSEIGNAGATVIGQTIARLLNVGFPLRSALSVARGQRLVGNQYVVVGDGGAEVAHPESGVPNVIFVESLGDDEYAIRLRSFPTDGTALGSTLIPFLDRVQTYFLAGGDLPTFTVSGAELQRYLELEDMPVIHDGELRWASDIDVARDLS